MECRRIPNHLARSSSLSFNWNTPIDVIFVICRAPLVSIMLVLMLQKQTLCDVLHSIDESGRMIKNNALFNQLSFLRFLIPALLWRECLDSRGFHVIRRIFYIYHKVIFALIVVVNAQWRYHVHFPIEVRNLIVKLELMQGIPFQVRWDIRILKTHTLFLYSLIIDLDLPYLESIVPPIKRFIFKKAH